MVIEILVTLLIIAAAGYIFFKDLKKSTSGKCNCGSCSSSCPMYKNHTKK